MNTGVNEDHIEAVAEKMAEPGVKMILAGPDVPVDRCVHETLARLNSHPDLDRFYSNRVLGNLVSEEDSVKSVVAKIMLGEADAGLVYTSDVTPAVAAELATVEIPLAFNVEAAYPIAVAKNSAAPQLSQQFIDLVLSPRGQAILAAHGFVPAVREVAELPRGK